MTIVICLRTSKPLTLESTEKRSRPGFDLVSVITFPCAFFCNAASAHVKWFSEFDIHEPPRSFWSILNSIQFIEMFLAAVVVMFVVAWTDLRVANQRWHVRMEVTCSYFHRWQPFILRIAVAFFFMALAISPESIVLTPELKTAPWIQETPVRIVQVLIAFCVLYRPTMGTSSVGIVCLYLLAIGHFGLFHLLDYVLFPILAFCLWRMGNDMERYWPQVKFVLRCAVAWTLMWGAVEKFAYPQWSCNLLDRPDVASIKMGFTSDFFVCGAGFVEFSCAFLVLTGRLSSNVSALVLIFFLTAATSIFGEVDAIGHLLIIVPLVFVVASTNRSSHEYLFSGWRNSFGLLPAAYVLGLALVMNVYAGLRAVLISDDHEHHFISAAIIKPAVTTERILWRL